MNATTVAQARAEHQRCHAAYVRHLDRCQRCRTALPCRTERDLGLDVDAAGERLAAARWTAAHPAAVAA